MPTTTANKSGFSNGDVIAEVTHGTAAVGKVLIPTTGLVIDELDITTLSVNGTPVAAVDLSGVTADSTELNLNDGALAGTSVASKTLALDAQKATDTLRATATLNVGGTGVPGAANVQTELTKAVTGFSDTVAAAAFTVTVPNAKHNALIELSLLGILGAGGAIGEGEASYACKYVLAIARTSGVATVADLSTLFGEATIDVAGGDPITSVVATISAMTGAVGATQTFDIEVAITRSGAGADNHKLIASAKVLNAFATGITIA